MIKQINLSYLIKKQYNNIKNGDIIIHIVEKTSDMMVGMILTLLLNCIYLPYYTSNYSLDNLKYIIKDTNNKIILINDESYKIENHIFFNINNNLNHNNYEKHINYTLIENCLNDIVYLFTSNSNIKCITKILEPQLPILSYSYAIKLIYEYDKKYIYISNKDIFLNNKVLYT